MRILKRKINKSDLKLMLNEFLYEKYEMMKMSYIIRIFIICNLLGIIMFVLCYLKVINLKIVGLFYLIVALVFIVIGIRFLDFHRSEKEYYQDNIIAYLIQRNGKEIAVAVTNSDIIDKCSIKLKILDKERYLSIDSRTMEKVKLEKQLIIQRYYTFDNDNVYEVYYL